MNDYKYSALTRQIIGCSMEVHKFLGNGFQEVIYQRALALEMRRAGISFQREIEVDIYYKDFIKPVGTRRADFIVENKVLVELKAISKTDDNHVNQVLAYLKAYKIEIGLLINFGTKSLEFRRFILSQEHRF